MDGHRATAFPEGPEEALKEYGLNMGSGYQSGQHGGLQTPG
jgi:hypothetical protein